MTNTDAPLAPQEQTNKAAHTPGPWQVVIDREQHTVHVRSEALEYVADFRTDDGYMGGSDIANATLASAAPNLLAACKLAFACLKASYDPADEDVELDAAIEALVPAIARAEGRLP